MDGLAELLQSGGSDAMSVINNQSGGALPAITLVITIIFPILFTYILFINNYFFKLIIRKFKHCFH